MSTLGLDSNDDKHGLNEPVLAEGGGSGGGASSSSSKWSSFRINRSGKATTTTPGATTSDHSLALAEEGAAGGDYSMFKTQHGNTSNTNADAPSSSVPSPPRHNILFSSAPRKKKPNIFHFHPLVTLEEKYGGDEYFVKRSRKPFLQTYLALNEPISLSKKKMTATNETLAATSGGYEGDVAIVEDEVQVDDGKVLSALSSNNNSTSLANLFAGIYQSSLTYYHDGKLQIRLPKDDVRLIMDPFIPPGILSVERNAGNSTSSSKSLNHNTSSSSLSSSLDEGQVEIGGVTTDYVDEEQGDTSRLLHHNRSSDLNYVLTVDPNLYKHVLEEISDSQWPCGVYWCCREAGEDKDQGVSINIAIGILFVVFSVFFFCAFIWQDPR